MTGFTIGSNNYSASMTVLYPIGLSPSSYISQSQYNTDFQAFLAAYPSKTDPLEAIASSILSSITQKYSQISGASLAVSLIPAVSITNPVSATTSLNIVTVYIGTFPVVLRSPARGPVN